MGKNNYPFGEILLDFLYFVWSDMHTDTYVRSGPNKKRCIYPRIDVQPKDDYSGATPGGAL